MTRTQLAAGFALAVGLTVLPFAAVMGGALSRESLLALIAGSGLFQVVVHLRLFLDLRSGGRGTARVLATVFGVLLMAIMLVGTLWVMRDLHLRMML